jgi:endoglucanase
MAFTVTMLSWGEIEYRSELSQAGELEKVKDAIKWGTDYFLKAHTGPTELYVQVNCK